MESPRLLYVVNQLDTFKSHRLPWVLGAKAAGFDVHVAMPPPDDPSFLHELGVTLHTVPFPRAVGRPHTELAALAQLYRLYRRLMPDLIHHVSAKIVVYGGCMARLARVPAVVNNVTGLGHGFLAEGLKGKAYRGVLLPGLSYAFCHPRSIAIFQNADDRDHLLSSGVRLTRQVIIPGSGVDTDEFSPVPEPSGPVTVMLASRLVEDKGVLEFIAAAERLRGMRIPTRFVLVGDADPEHPGSVPTASLLQWVRSGTVEWWGRRSDMADVLRQAHIFCLPSYREGLPRVVLEAAACGRPIVATDVPGCRQAVAHEDNGLLVRPRDSRSLAEAIRRLVLDPDERQRLGARGRQRAESEFAITRIVPQILRTYEELLREIDGLAPSPESG